MAQFAIKNGEGIIPQGIIEIRAGAFFGGTLQSVIIPNSVKKIGEHAFQDCSSLQPITIPNSVTEIGESAFAGCSSLQSVTIPNSVTKIGQCAFQGCSSLQSLTIPDSVTEIGENAFWCCRSLQSLTIPDSVTEIGSYAFSGCRSLQSLTIPNSVTKIGYNAFRDCSSLKQVYSEIQYPNSRSIDSFLFDSSIFQSCILIIRGTPKEYRKHTAFRSFSKIKIDSSIENPFIKENLSQNLIPIQ